MNSPQPRRRNHHLFLLLGLEPVFFFFPEYLCVDLTLQLREFFTCFLCAFENRPQIGKKINIFILVLQRPPFERKIQTSPVLSIAGVTKDKRDPLLDCPWASLLPPAFCLGGVGPPQLTKTFHVSWLLEVGCAHQHYRWVLRKCQTSSCRAQGL